MNDEYLIKIDEPRIQETCDAYFKWKDLNMLFVYDTGVNSEELKKIPVSKTATVGDYQKAGKRPHIRIIESIINAKKLEPTVTFNIRRGQIVEKI